jgi:hypothetical protein
VRRGGHPIFESSHAFSTVPPGSHPNAAQVEKRVHRTAAAVER